MYDVALRRQAMIFAACIAAVAFLLAIYATPDAVEDPTELRNAGIIALVCGILSWGAADRLLALISGSVNAAVNRLAAAAAGDLASPMPSEVGAALPGLSESMDSLFEQVRTNIDNANTLAMFDPVTALSNRLHFRSETDAILASLPAKTRSALFFIDLDNFKSVNDSLGHAAGDQLLIMIANRLRSIAATRSKGRAPVIGRLAGDEFTVFLPDPRGEKGAEEFATEILRALSEPFGIHGQTVCIGASIGVAMRSGSGAELADLMRAADVAMYHAKENGRGRFEFYSDALAERLDERTRLDKDLRQAFTLNQFGYEFQPQVRLHDRSLVAVEALMRWNHPVDGTKQPKSFMTAAEQSGLLAELADWSFESAAAIIGRWNRIGNHQRLAINLSKRQAESGDLYRRAMEALQRHEAPASMLEIEIADRLANDSGDALVKELALLRDAGATITIDNFAKSPINVARLRAMPVQRVKIDRILIREVATDHESRAVLQAAVSMLVALGKETIALGVESEAQLDVLRVMGCNAVQGYAIARPSNEAGLHRWIGDSAKARRSA